MSDGAERDRGGTYAGAPDAGQVEQREIGAASAVLMTKYGVDSEIAFEIIVIMASEMERSVNDVAQEIVDQQDALDEVR